MKTLREPRLQAGFSRRQIYARNADLRESQCTRPLRDLRNELTIADDHRPIVETPRTDTSHLLHWATEDDTRAFAEALAAQPDIIDAFISLHGDLGAGKTTLVRHLLRALGVQGRIKSPTYAVVEPHEVGTLNIWHFDFYRFNDPREWEDAGFRELFASPGLKLAEWPEKAAALIPRADLAITLEALTDTARRARLQAQTPRGKRLLQAFLP